MGIIPRLVFALKFLFRIVGNEGQVFNIFKYFSSLARRTKGPYINAGYALSGKL